MISTTNNPAIQSFFQLTPDITFLNHGSFGAVPLSVFSIYQNWQRMLEKQPVEFLGRKAPFLLTEARDTVATYLNTKRDNLVFIPNTTVGINTIARSLRLNPGDELLTTDHEYGAMERTWRFYSKKHGFNIHTVSIPIPLSNTETFIDRLFGHVNHKTRVIFLSHITSPTALIFPIKEICLKARNQGILTVIDGAHVPGQIELNLDEIGADFYVGNFHKWLCAPKGSAFLYARPEMQHLLEPLTISWGWETESPGPSPFVDLFEWTGTRDISSYLTVPSAIRFHQENHWDEVISNCHQMALEVRADFSTLFTFPPLSTELNQFSQMISVEIPDSIPIDEVKSMLYDDFAIEIPVIPWNSKTLLRISIQGYNSCSDIQKLYESLKCIYKL